MEWMKNLKKEVSDTQEFNEEHRNLVEEGDVEQIRTDFPKSEYEKNKAMVWRKE